MIKRILRELPYIAAGLFLLYILVSFIQVDMYNMSNPERIGEYNFFSVMVRIGEQIHS